MDDGIVPLIHSHVNALCYNITSIVCVIALMNQRTKINSSDVANARSYVSKECLGVSGQAGGGNMPAQYFGYNLDSDLYSASNSTQEQMVSLAHFGAEGYIRPAMDVVGQQFPLSTSQSGGGSGGTHNRVHAHVHMHDSKLKTSIKKYVNSVIKTNSLTISKTALHELLKVIDIHMACLLRDISSKKSQSLSTIKAILSLKRHSVFN